MSEYYAVQRSGEYLEHYGVKGMKWGVKKALAKSTSQKTNKALAKQYKKASKKLAKLQARTDIEKQKNVARVQGKKGLRSTAAAVGLGGVSLLTSGLQYKSKRIPEHFAFNSKTGKTDHISEHYKWTKAKPGVAHYISGGLTAASLAKGAYHTGKAMAASHRATAKGHAKAVAKANAWKKSMNEAFAGTKYGNKVGNNKKRKRR